MWEGGVPTVGSFFIFRLENVQSGARGVDPFFGLGGGGGGQKLEKCQNCRKIENCVC